MITVSRLMTKRCPYVDEIDAGTLTITASGRAPELHDLARRSTRSRRPPVSHEEFTRQVAALLPPVGGHTGTRRPARGTWKCGRRRDPLPRRPDHARDMRLQGVARRARLRVVRRPGPDRNWPPRSARRSRSTTGRSRSGSRAGRTGLAGLLRVVRQVARAPGMRLGGHPRRHRGQPRTRTTRCSASGRSATAASRCGT